MFLVLGLSLVFQPAFADGFKIAPFILYEEATQNIVIDGVSTKYALGIAGVELRKKYGNSITISSKLGYGQNNDQKTSFAGANFSGKVTGSYFNIGGKYEFYKKKILYSSVLYKSQKEISKHQALQVKEIIQTSLDQQTPL